VPEASNLRKVTYRVRRGDTLHSVARRYNVNERDVILWNNLTGPALFAGQRLELTVVAAKPRSTAKSGKPAATQGAARKSSATQPVAKAPSKVTKTGASHGKVVAATR
jgi:LysM repeat protein